MDGYLVLEVWQLRRPKRVSAIGSFYQEHRIIIDDCTSILYVVEWHEAMVIGTITRAFVESLTSGKADQEDAAWVRMRPFPLGRIAVTIE